MSKKDKQVTSKGGNSFLTIKKAPEEVNTTSTKTQVDSTPTPNTQNNTSNKTEKIAVQKKVKSDEEKIEEFTEKVTKILDKLEGLKSIFKSFISKRYPESFEKFKLMILQGKLKFLKPFLPAIIVMQKVTERWFKKEDEVEEKVENKEENKEPEEPRKPVTFLELAEKNIIFTDNKKAPLYSIEQLRGKNGYVASDSVITPMIMENIINAFREVAPKAKAIPTPESGKYAGIPMSEVMERLNENDIIFFLEYVRNFPRGYVGKNYRITESFAGWAVSGTPDD